MSTPSNWPRGSFLAALCALVALPILGEESPVDPAYRKAHDQFARMEQELRSLQAKAAREVVGRDADRWPYSPRWVPWDAESVERATAPALERARTARRDLIRRRLSWDRGGTSLDEFHMRTYSELSGAVGPFWEAQLDLAKAYINTWEAEVSKLNAKQHEAYWSRKGELEQKVGWGSARYEAGMKELAKNQSDERKKLFLKIGAQYQQLLDDLVASRARWSTELWRWVDFAGKRTRADDDVHARGRHELERALYNAFSYGGQRGTYSLIDYLCGFPGSPDRIITGWGDDWLSPAPFPKLQIQDGCLGCLRMNGLGAVPVERYRSEDAPIDPLRATSLRVTLADPLAPISEARPLQWIHIVAETDGLPVADDDRLIARVETRGGGTIDVPLDPFSTEARSLYVSSPVLIATPGADKNEGVLEVAACTGDEVDVRLGTFVTRVDIGLATDLIEPAPCTVPDDLPRLSLVPVGPTAITFDPAAPGEDERITFGYGALPRDARGVGMPSPPAVRFRDERNEPLDHEPIVWVMPERDERFISYTDETGVARIDFRAGARGTFTAFIDGVPTGEPIPDGKYRLVASPSDPTFAAVLAEGPPVFEIDLVSPTTIDFIDRGRQRLDGLISQQPFGVQVWLGRKDSRRLRNAKTIKVRLDPSVRLRTPLELEAKHVNGRAFESDVIYSARTEPSSLAALARLVGDTNLLVEPNEIITLSFGEASIGAKVYPTPVRLAEARVRAGLLFWRDALSASLEAVHDGPDRMRQLRLRGFTERGLDWLDDSGLPLHYRVSAAAVYLELLDIPEPALGLYRAPREHAAFGSRQHKFVCNFEEARVKGALQQAHESTIVTAGERLRRIGGGLVDFVVGIPDMLFVTPFLGAYTAVTGWTAEGETATNFERVIGGFDAISAAFAARQLVGGAASRLVSTGKAALGAGQRAIIGEGVLRGGLSFSRVLATETGAALARQAPEYVVDGLVEAIGEEIFRPGPETEGRLRYSYPSPALIIPKVGKRAARPRSPTRIRLERSIEYRHRYYQERMYDLVDAVDASRGLENEIADLSSRLGGTSGSARLDLERRIASNRRQLARLNERIPAIQRRLQRHLEVGERSRRFLNELRDVDLPENYVREMLERDKNWRPYGSQSIRGVKAQLHYERQVAALLESKGFVPGRRTPVNTAYQSPLDEGYLSGAGGGRPRKAVKNPTPDHINYDTLEMGDSKYYKPFSQLRPAVKVRGLDRKGKVITKVIDERVFCAAEIADTVEKARMVQQQVILDRMVAELRDKGEMASAARLRKEARRKVQELAPPITIFTPEPMPDDIAEMIRKLSPGSAIKFATVKPDVEGWLGS